jgi:hypothetical protein
MRSIIQSKDAKDYPQYSYFVLTNTFYLIIFIAVFLAIYQFIFNRSLWLDEACLSLNIINKGFVDLTNPLDYNQVAPVGFLFIEKILVLIFGKNEYALRIFSLISFLTSIPFFYLLSYKLTKNKTIALISTSIFSINYRLLFYSSEVKQYSTDVLITVIFLYLFINLQLNKDKGLFVYAIFGSIALWFSNVSIVILFVTGVYHFYAEVYKKHNYKCLMFLLLWGISFLIYYKLLIYNHPTTEFMKSYWAYSFLPFNIFSSDFYHFIYWANIIIYGSSLGFGPFWPIPLIISSFAIIYTLKHQNYTLLYLCLSPIIVHLLLSGFKLYPFETRFILYIIPLIILIYSIGLCQLFNFVKMKIPKLPKPLLIIPVLIMFYPIHHQGFPIQEEEIKDSMHYIKKNIKKDELIYVYYSAYRAFQFYNETGIININNPIVIGTSSHNENVKYTNELLNLNGKTWLLFSHVYPWGTENNEEKYMVEFLLKNNSELLDVQKYKGSSVYYIDTKKPKDFPL